MKSLFSRTMIGALIAFAAILFILALFAPPAALGQVTPNTYGTFSDVPASVEGSTTISVNSQPIDVWKDRGLAVFANFRSLTNNETKNVTLYFEPSYDGTNWAKQAIGLRWDVQIAQTNYAIASTNFPPSILNNVRKLRLGQIVNGTTNHVFLTNIVYSRSN